MGAPSQTSQVKSKLPKFNADLRGIGKTENKLLTFSNQGVVRKSLASSRELSSDEQAEMQSDVESIRIILKEAKPSRDRQYEIISIVRKYEPDRFSPSTFLLDKFLQLLKKSNVGWKEGLVEKNALVYDRIWYVLNNEMIIFFKASINKSHEKTSGPNNPDAESYFSSENMTKLAKQEAMGMWGMVKGLGIGLASSAGPVVASELSKDFDECGKIFFGEEWMSESIDFGFFRMNPGQVGETGGSIIWTIVAFARTRGKAGEGPLLKLLASLDKLEKAQKAKKALAVAEGLQGVYVGAKGIAEIIEAEQKKKRNKDQKLTIDDLLKNPDFISQVEILFSSSVNTYLAVKGSDSSSSQEKKTRARIHLLLSTETVLPDLGKLIDTAQSGKPEDEKEREYGQVLTELISKLVTLAFAGEDLYHEKNEAGKASASSNNPPKMPVVEILPPEINTPLPPKRSLPSGKKVPKASEITVDAEFKRVPENSAQENKQPPSESSLLRSITPERNPENLPLLSAKNISQDETKNKAPVESGAQIPETHLLPSGGKQSSQQNLLDPIVPTKMHLGGDGEIGALAFVGPGNGKDVVHHEINPEQPKKVITHKEPSNPNNILSPAQLKVIEQLGVIQAEKSGVNDIRNDRVGSKILTEEASDAPPSSLLKPPSNMTSNSLLAPEIAAYGLDKMKPPPMENRLQLEIPIMGSEIKAPVETGKFMSGTKIPSPPAKQSEGGSVIEISLSGLHEPANKIQGAPEPQAENIFDKPPSQVIPIRKGEVSIASKVDESRSPNVKDEPASPVINLDELDLQDTGDKGTSGSATPKAITNGSTEFSKSGTSKIKTPNKSANQIDQYLKTLGKQGGSAKNRLGFKDEDWIQFNQDRKENPGRALNELESRLEKHAEILEELSKVETEVISPITDIGKKTLGDPVYQQSIFDAREKLSRVMSSPNKSKTVALGTNDRSGKISGWKNNEEGVLRTKYTANEAGVSDSEHYFDREEGHAYGGEGDYYGSHAEKQAAEHSSGYTIAVDREMCPNCYKWFNGRAVNKKETWFVADPKVVRVFFPNGEVITIAHGKY